MRLLTHRAAAVFTLCMLASGGLTACGNPIDAGLRLALEGTWKDVDGLAIEFDGDQAVVTDFGSSPLGTNPSVFGTGHAFIDDVSCDADSCTGRIVDPEFVDGILQRFGRADVTIERNGDQLTVTRTSGGAPSTFTKVSGTNPGGGNGGGNGSLTTSASCAQWWAALKADNPWKVTQITTSSYNGAPTADVRITFSGTDQYTVTNPNAVGWANPQGEIHFGDKIFGTDYCRFAIWGTDEVGTPIGQVQVWFMKSLGNRQLRVNLSSTSEAEYWLLQAQ